MAELKKPDLNALKDKSPMAVALATLLLLLFSFFVFRYFGTNKSINDKLNGEGAQDVVIEESTDEQANVDSESNGESQDNQNQGAVQGSTAQQETSVWVANDIEPNTLQGKTYTVKRGDTLWEI
ncbi:MAG TPA: LysM domain-containing protein, partial [candidate division WWE3 bacterium]|nr:LysM domain-containing protein [candidate division WWE3 bacterium]